MDYKTTLTFVTLLYLAQDVARTKGQMYELSGEGSQHHDNYFMYATQGGDKSEDERTFADYTQGGPFEVVTSSSSLSSSPEQVNQALIENVVAKTYGHEVKLKEEKATELGSKAKRHEHFAGVYIKISQELENKAKEKLKLSEFETNKAKTHENTSSEYTARARQVSDLLDDEENKGEEHLNDFIQEFWSSNLAENNAKGAFAHVKNEEARAKGEYIKYSELEKLAHVLLNEAKVYEELGKLAEDNAQREKQVSVEKDAISNEHRGQALRFFLPKVFEFRRKARNSYNSYLDYVMKAEDEIQQAREKQLKAAHEVKLANAYLQNAQENSIFATVERDRSESYKAKGEELSKTAPEPASAEIVVSSKSVVRKSVKLVSGTTRA